MQGCGLVIMVFESSPVSRPKITVLVPEQLGLCLKVCGLGLEILVSHFWSWQSAIHLLFW